MWSTTRHRRLPGELGLSEDAFQQLAMQGGHTAIVSQAEPPASMAMLLRKIGGERLGRDDFHGPSCRTSPACTIPRSS
jgi:hypothetical protein